MLKATASELRGTGAFKRSALLSLVGGAMGFMATHLNRVFFPSVCVLRLAPDVADAISRSDEMASYKDASPWVTRAFTDPSLHDPGCHTLEYGLPPFLYGLRLAVDDALPPGTARINGPLYEMVEQPAPGLPPEPRCVGVEDILEITGCISAAAPDHVVGG